MRMRMIVGACAGALLLSSCSFEGIYDLPLPGGADLGDHPYTVKAQFRDVLDLVPQSGVKVNEVPVGRVEAITLAPDGWTAEVTMSVRGDVDLPGNSLARLRQSSLLGEKYIELTAPDTGKEQGKLANGAYIGLDRTNRNTEVEEVLGALSMLLNGGGVDQLRTIANELNQVADGNEPQLRALLTNTNKLVSGLDARRGDITKALDGLNKLSGTLDGQKDKIAQVLDEIGPGLQVLAEQRPQLVTMLQNLDQLSDVAVGTINQSKADVVADLKALTPTLQKLSEAGANLPKALELLLSFPFPDSAVAGVKGDYFNLYAKIDLNLQEVVNNLSRSRQNPLQDIPLVGDLLGGQDGAQPGAPPPLGVPDLGNQPSTPSKPCSNAGGLLGSILGGQRC
ncbi:MCE family protein [Kibdelosporangium persicum]|uniref:Phospholipid/cholesterol/gamma-HCH transport system substrate-binding protein n=1 Tax=Kibdelosporangium persicum TaxID=2698649 RepID=A0ABX2FEC0_9PSEU|nr:MCE family protein [Kibdelosporangium persicum]NRN69717.1 Phospholipid/cholesterol/gamma-HCH transport system substrate-binding protein [Kibdelosporangium persicum]